MLGDLVLRATLALEHPQRLGHVRRETTVPTRAFVFRPRLEHAEALKVLDLFPHGVVPLRALWPFDRTIVGRIVIGVNARKRKVLAVNPSLVSFDKTRIALGKRASRLLVSLHR